MLPRGISSQRAFSIRSAVSEFLIGCSLTGPILGIRTSIAKTARASRAMKNFIQAVARDIADWANDFWYGRLTHEDQQLIRFWEAMGEATRREREDGSQ